MTPNISAFARYPIRVCRSLHTCALCGEAITLGQEYHDGGFCRRAHVACVDQAVAKDPEKV